MLRRLVLLVVSCAAVLLAAAVLFFVPGLVGYRVFAVPSGNMEETLPVGSYIAVREDAAVGRGDIIVHRMPDVPGGTFTRRVVATGGDTIACCGGGNVILNGEELREPYVFEDDRQPFGPVTVPPSRLFLLGDHRSASRDSRSYLDDAFSGTVAEGDVIGVASGHLR